MTSASRVGATDSKGFRNFIVIECRTNPNPKRLPPLEDSHPHISTTQTFAPCLVCQLTYSTVSKGFQTFTQWPVVIAKITHTIGTYQSKLAAVCLPEYDFPVEHPASSSSNLRG